MAKRNYRVKGIQDFIVIAGVCFFLCLWAIRDAWFPTPKVLEKHPLRVEVAFPVDGTIKEFHVAKGDNVYAPKEGYKPTLLASLNDMRVRTEYDEKKEVYLTLGNEAPEREGLLKEVNELKERMDQMQLYCPKLGDEKGGKVAKLLVSRFEEVKAGQPVMVIEPNKGFYLFNKSLSILTFIGFWLFLGIHVMTR